MAIPAHRPIAKAQKDTTPKNPKPLARGYGDEHGGYLVDAQAEHTMADPGVVSPEGQEQTDPDTHPGRGAAADGAKKGG